MQTAEVEETLVWITKFTEPGKQLEILEYVSNAENGINAKNLILTIWKS
jgi:hypothetical protein